MKSQDRFLIAIVLCIVLLVATVVVVALLRDNQPAYRPDDTPDGVAYNYLLALQLGDYERAYGYLSPTLAHYPASVDLFVQDMRRAPWAFNLTERDVSLNIDKVIPGAVQTIVQVRETSYYRGGLFGSGESSYTFDVTLKHQEDGWKIVEGGRYWYDCWSSTSASCK